MWDDVPGRGTNRGRVVLLALGGLYTVLGVVVPFGSFDETVGLGTEFVLVVLGAGPGLVLLYSGLRLPATDIRAEFYPTIARWCLGAIGLLLGILAVVAAADALRSPVQNALVLTALGSVAGLAAGGYDARAKTRTRELELRNAELERTREDLEESLERFRTTNERLEQFAYAASHDLQEPLRMVSTYLQLLERRHGDELDGDAEEYLAFAVDGADRMRGMIASLLEYSEVSTLGRPLEPTDPEAVLERVLGDLQDRIDETDATVTSDELPRVQADPDQLEVVLENLLSNAITYAGDDRPRVHVSADRAGEMCRFSVADEGIGIDPEFHARVFTVFENLHPSDELAETSGAGIGLALCERIVERHGGDIWVESEPGEGSTFYFTLPQADAEAADAQPTPGVSERSSS